MVACATALLALVGSYGLSQAAASQAPTMALRFNPLNSQALGKTALVRFQEGGEGLARAEQLSLRSIMVNPTAVSAVQTLAFVASARGDVQSAERISHHAQALSRRDVGTQLWLIEREVAKDNVAGALNHYDIALTTSRNIRPVLIPILVNSTSDPAIVAALAPHLARRPVWRQDFVDALLADAPNAAAVAALSRRLDRLGAPLELVEKTALSNRLIEERLYRDAALLMGRTGTAGLVLNGAFRQNEDGNPFNWRLKNDVDVSGEMTLDADMPGLRAFAAPGRGGDIAQQLLLLPAGRYRIATRIDMSQPQHAGAAPYWTLTCAGGEQIGSIDISRFDYSGTTVAGIDVPGGCPAQWLVLHLRPAGDGIDMLFRQVSITPVR